MEYLKFTQLLMDLEILKDSSLLERLEILKQCRDTTSNESKRKYLHHKLQEIFWVYMDRLRISKLWHKIRGNLINPDRLGSNPCWSHQCIDRHMVCRFQSQCIFYSAAPSNRSRHLVHNHRSAPCRRNNLAIARLYLLEYYHNLLSFRQTLVLPLIGTG